MTPFFLVGCERSGTTLLRLMLTAHPRLCVPPEGDFLLRLKGTVQDPTDPLERARFLDRFLEIEKCREWGLDLPTLWRAVQAANPQTYAELAAVPYEAYAAHTSPGATRWGDKNPGYLQEAPRLLKMYPRAKVIHLYRDGRDVAVSWMNVPFGPASIGEAAQAWRQAVAVGNALAQAAPQAVLQVRYEALVASPEAELRRICAFLGEPFDPQMLAYDQMNREQALVPKHRLAWHANTLRPPDPNLAGRWRQSLSGDDVALFERIAGPVLSANGYDLAAI